MKALSGELGCDASYVTSLVDGLEARALVERRAHPSDRRAKLVVLTTEGERTRQLLLDRLHEPPDFLSVLNTDEIAQFGDLLRRLVTAATVPQSPND